MFFLLIFFTKNTVERIFIQIASYRDPELIPTIKSILENSRRPENLVFSIARQFHPDDKFDDLSEYENDNRFRIMNIPHEESLGVCWARSLTQQLYDGEEYTMQIDSHMRFVKDWDITLINMLTSLQKIGYKKPLLTSYVSSYDPTNDPEGRVQEPWRMVFDKFIPEGAIFFLPEAIPNNKELNLPIPSRFYSAHFCFTLGEFTKEVQHDPNMYFHGEEISIAVRAYTHGYDLFHPHIILCWHEYTRNGRTKQWDDDKNWVEKNNASHLRNRKLFSMDGEVYNEEEFGIYGFGKVRTLKDYEIYAGVSFSKRAVQQYTLDKHYPPNPYDYKTEEEWLNSFTTLFKHTIELDKKQLPEKDYDFWVVAYHGHDDNTLYRMDAGKSELEYLTNSPDNKIRINREFQSSQTPKYWVVWPHRISTGWGERIVGLI